MESELESELQRGDSQAIDARLATGGTPRTRRTGAVAFHLGEEEGQPRAISLSDAEDQIRLINRSTQLILRDCRGASLGVHPS